MKRTLTFLNRNFKEMTRDPILYIFCLGFPLVMLIMFSVIHQFTNGATPTFEPVSLIPGIMMFSFTFVMLELSLQVSKDKTSALLKRLYTSPMKSIDFILGYAILGILVGLAQALCTIFFGYIVSLIQGSVYFSFGRCMLLILTQIPILIFFVFLGILSGTALNEKSAPGICSILISAAGVLGGSWMPLEIMGGFKTFCNYLPFYPSVCLGRIATKATYVSGEVYAFSNISIVGLVLLVVYTCVILVGGVLIFNRRKDN